MFLLSKLSTDFAIEDSILVPFIDRAPHLRFQLEESTQKTESFGVAMFLIVIGSTRLNFRTRSTTYADRNTSSKCSLVPASTKTTQYGLCKSESRLATKWNVTLVLL